MLASEVTKTGTVLLKEVWVTHVLFFAVSTAGTGRYNENNAYLVNECMKTEFCNMHQALRDECPHPLWFHFCNVFKEIIRELDPIYFSFGKAKFNEIKKKYKGWLNQEGQIQHNCLKHDFKDYLTI